MPLGFLSHLGSLSRSLSHGAPLLLSALYQSASLPQPQRSRWFSGQASLFPTQLGNGSSEEEAPTHEPEPLSVPC